MKLKTSPETKAILDSLPSEMLIELTKIYRNQESKKAIRTLLEMLVSSQERRIIDMAGNVQSMDNMIQVNNLQSFHRGRISFAVLLRSIMENAELYAEKKAEGE